MKKKVHPVQAKLFSILARKTPENMLLADELAELLGVSRDSVYRRIRNDDQATPLSAYELLQICKHYNISLDALLKSESEIIPFNLVSTVSEDFTIDAYVGRIRNQARGLASDNPVQAVLLANDLPVFQLFQVPELAAFKLFFWQKSSLGLDEFRNRRFSLKTIDKRLIDMCRETVDAYAEIPSIEIIGDQAIESIVRQLLYYLEYDYFATKDDALTVGYRFIDLIDHLEKQSDLGYKYTFGQTPSGTPGNYELYYNEMIVLNEMILVRTQTQTQVYISNGPLDYLQTADTGFFKAKMNNIRKLTAVSIHLSSESRLEPERQFARLRKLASTFVDRVKEHKSWPYDR